MTSHDSAAKWVTAVEKISKLSNTRTFVPWKRTVTDQFKAFGLWKWINTLKTRPTEQVAAAIWDEGQETACTALRMCVEGNAYTEIENEDHAFAAWEKLEKLLKPRGSGVTIVPRQSRHIVLSIIITRQSGLLNHLLQ